MNYEVIDNLKVEVLEFSGTVETVEKASLLSGEPREKIAKTLLFKLNNEYVVFIVRGDRKVDYIKANDILGTKPQLASPEYVKRILGTEPGAVSPIDRQIKKLKIFLDPKILEEEYILCGGGSKNKLYKVKTSDLISYLNPNMLDIFK
ncbi:aminoacyl-tRNA deacylase [Fervidicoccus fontis]|jgi:prolyl-tRNA editing enzyme YbaK/EbsC (Cys-tRNA(Pro) deacylase)|uniref:YbaK/EbsC family protein n=1 Tax=Fervidicoccus fontis TaxID=683846 RepID=A0A2J6N3V4_9CREN|nr:YbaK/EbsC family protein [Fervidicoccus fontis]PMB75906.1 MAG: hypothetical protein C0188_01050 [Fervidicoccus fontis]PMB77395.1 MAG: hypothetical protein C0177_03175 [Fervidicoccus fontis]HEW63502.1 YbaK/EbsC family protein [Fervidicoccus fontis]